MYTICKMNREEPKGAFRQFILQIIFESAKPGFFDYNTIAVDDIIVVSGKLQYRTLLEIL